MKSWRERLAGRDPSWIDLCIRMVLRLACPIYMVVVSLRNWTFDWGLRRSYRCEVPVFSIGNLSVGGTGKTPAVAWLVHWLQERGLKVVVLSRGYGKLENGHNDEAMELEIKLSGILHLQHWDRVATARKAVQEFGAQVIVLDDGFQHRRLARNLDLVLLDATDSPAAQWLLPAGLRREPMSALRRASIVLLTRADQVNRSTLGQLTQMVSSANPKAVCLRTAHRPQSLIGTEGSSAPLEALREARVLAFCGIGNPQAFFQTLQDLGANLIGTRSWADHHAFTLEDIEWLTNWTCQHPETILVCTVKDWVKIQRSTIGKNKLWALSINLEFLEDPQPLASLLTTALRC